MSRVVIALLVIWGIGAALIYAIYRYRLKRAEMSHEKQMAREERDYEAILDDDDL